MQRQSFIALDERSLKPETGQLPDDRLANRLRTKSGESPRDRAEQRTDRSPSSELLQRHAGHIPGRHETLE